MATRSSMTSPTALLAAGCFLVVLLPLPMSLASEMIHSSCIDFDNAEQLIQLTCTELVERANAIIRLMELEKVQIKASFIISNDEKITKTNALNDLINEIQGAANQLDRKNQELQVLKMWDHAQPEQCELYQVLRQVMKSPKFDSYKPRTEVFEIKANINRWYLKTEWLGRKKVTDKTLKALVDDVKAKYEDAIMAVKVFTDTFSGKADLDYPPAIPSPLEIDNLKSKYQELREACYTLDPYLPALMQNSGIVATLKKNKVWITGIGSGLTLLAFYSLLTGGGTNSTNETLPPHDKGFIAPNGVPPAANGSMPESESGLVTGQPTATPQIMQSKTGGEDDDWQFVLYGVAGLVVVLLLVVGGVVAYLKKTGRLGGGKQKQADPEKVEEDGGNLKQPGKSQVKPKSAPGALGLTDTPTTDTPKSQGKPKSAPGTLGTTTTSTTGKSQVKPKSAPGAAGGGKPNSSTGTTTTPTSARGALKSSKL